MKMHNLVALATYACLACIPILFAQSDPLDEVPLSSWYSLPVADLFLDSKPSQSSILEPYILAQQTAISLDDAFVIAQELSRDELERHKEKKRRRRQDKKKVIDTVAYASYCFLESIVSDMKDTEKQTRARSSNVSGVLSSMVTALQVTDEFYSLKKSSPYTDKALYQFYDEMLCVWEDLYEVDAAVRAATVGTDLQEYIALSANDKPQWIHSMIDNANEAMCLYDVFTSISPLLPVEVVTATLRSVTKDLIMNDNHAPNALQQFIYTNPVGTALRKVLTGNPLFSRLSGAYADSILSRSHIKGFVKKHNIDMDEAAGEIKEYRTFNQFFTRKLKDGARPLAAGKDILAAPADGHVLYIDEISERTVFGVKKNKFTLEKFLGDKELAAKYEGGTMLIFRLAPWDYHRFHFPADGTPQKWKRIRGSYESVHPVVYASGVQPLSQNERHLIKVSTEEFDDMIMVPVGALCVGRIKETYKPLQRYAKGDEAGYFAFGGSTVVMLFKPGVVDVEQHIVQNSRRGKEIPLKMGEAIGRRIKAND